MTILKYSQKQLNTIIRNQLGFDASDIYTSEEVSLHGLAKKMRFKNADINREISKRWEMIKLKTKVVEQQEYKVSSEILNTSGQEDIQK